MNAINKLITQISTAPEDFTHLQILLHRAHTRLEPEFGRKFLFISHDSFGLVKLNDLSVENNYLHLVLEDASTGQSAPFTIDINEKSFQFLMIAWEDVQDIYSHDKNTSCACKDLLEFDFN